MRRAAVVGAHRPHPADEAGHLGARQAHELRAVEEHLLGGDDVSFFIQLRKPSASGSSTANESASVISSVASPRPAAKGTSIPTPAARAACSTPTFPAS